MYNERIYKYNIITVLLFIVIVLQLVIILQMYNMNNERNGFEFERISNVNNNVKLLNVAECEEITPAEVCLESSIQDVKEFIAKENEIKTEDFWLKETKNSYIKPYMDYRAITCKTSKQYKFIQREDVNEDKRGFLMQDGEWYCVALGEYFGDIGEKYIFTLSNGNEVKVVKSEAKSNRHTCSDNYLGQNGHILEFLINTNSQWMKEQDVIYHGSLNACDELKGDIVKIEKVVDNT